MAAPVGLLPGGLPFFRRELLQLSTIRSTSLLATLPPGKKETIRVLAADDTGVLLSLQVVKGIPEVSWRISTSAKVDAVAFWGLDSKKKPVVCNLRRGLFPLFVTHPNCC